MNRVAPFFGGLQILCAGFDGGDFSIRILEFGVASIMPT